jgi:hypothetical protein
MENFYTLFSLFTNCSNNSWKNFLLSWWSYVQLTLLLMIAIGIHSYAVWWIISYKKTSSPILSETFLSRKQTWAWWKTFPSFRWKKIIISMFQWIYFDNQPKQTKTTKEHNERLNKKKVVNRKTINLSHREESSKHKLSACISALHWLVRDQLSRFIFLDLFVRIVIFQWILLRSFLSIASGFSLIIIRTTQNSACTTSDIYSKSNR